MMDSSMANLKKGLVSDPIELRPSQREERSRTFL